MTRPFIVIEGADGSGKTVLAEELRNVGFAYEHLGAPDRDSFTFYNSALERYPDGGAVLDRFHVGSFVYGNAFRNWDDLSPYQHWILEGKLLAHNSLMLWANPPVEVMDADLAKGPIDETASIYEATDKQPLVRELYKYYMTEATSLPVMEYDYTHEDATRKMVADILSYQEYMASVDLPVGRSNPFGNQYSPLFCFVGSGLSYYLFKLLRAAKISLNQVCIVDSLPRGFEGSGQWLDTRFVSFGDAAHNQLRTLKIPDTHFSPIEIMEKNNYSNAIPIHAKLLMDLFPEEDNGHINL